MTNRMWARVIVAVVAMVVLPGCASLMQPGPDLSAAQMKEMVKDKSASVICGYAVGVWGTVRTVVITMDQNSIKDGGIVVDGEKGCAASINSVAPPRAPSPPPVATPLKPPV